MPVRSMPRELPTLRSGLSLYLSMTDWTVCGAGDAHRRQQSCTAWHWNFSSMHCMPRLLEVAPDEQLPDDSENCLHQKCAPARCTVWSPSSTSIRRKVQATDRKGRLSVVAFRGELLSFNSFSDLTAASRTQLALEQRTNATVVKESRPSLSSGFRFMKNPNF